MNRKIILLLFLCGFAVCSKPPITFSQEKPFPIEADSEFVISITRAEEIYLNKEKISHSAISQKIEQAFKNQSLDKQIIYIKADRDIRYGTVVSVIRKISDAGISCVGLVARKKGEARESLQSNTTCISGLKNGNSSSVNSKSIIIKINSKRFIRLNGRRTSYLKLSNKLEKILSHRSNKKIFIKAPKEMVYGEVIKIIDKAKSAGAQPIELKIN